MLIKFADDTKLGDIANVREDRDPAQEYVGRLDMGRQDLGGCKIEDVGGG